MSEHKPRPFTKDIAEQMKLGIAASFDEKETYSCSKKAFLTQGMLLKATGVK